MHEESFREETIREEGTDEFVHTLDALIGGLCDAGFAITDFREPHLIAARRKPSGLTTRRANGGDGRHFPSRRTGEFPHPVQRTRHRQPRPVHHVRVDHRRLHVFMPQQFLHRADVRPVLEHVRREAVS